MNIAVWFQHPTIANFPTTPVPCSLWVRVLILEARLRHDIEWLLLAAAAPATDTPVMHRMLGHGRSIVLFGSHIVRQEQRPRLA